MPTDRRPRVPSPRDDDWIPPAWNPAARETPSQPRVWEDGPVTRAPRGVPSQQRPANSVHPRESGLVLGLAFAPAVSGIVGLLSSVAPMLSGGGSLPIGLIVVILLQVGVAAILHVNGHESMVASWIATLICSAVLLPLLALQVALLREPYTSWSRGSASPALVATLIVGMLVVVGATWAVAVGWGHPDEAGLLFMPQALMVPALIGMRATVTQGPGLRMFAAVMLICAVATGVGWLVQPEARVFIPAGALAFEVVGLWATGHGPWFHATSGDIVRLLYGAMLTLAVVLVVAVPFVAMWVKQGADMVDASRRAARPRVSRQRVGRGPVVPR